MGVVMTVTASSYECVICIVMDAISHYIFWDLMTTHT